MSAELLRRCFRITLSAQTNVEDIIETVSRDDTISDNIVHGLGDNAELQARIDFINIGKDMLRAEPESENYPAFKKFMEVYPNYNHVPMDITGRIISKAKEYNNGYKNDLVKLLNYYLDSEFPESVRDSLDPEKRDEFQIKQAFIKHLENNNLTNKAYRSFLLSEGLPNNGKGFQINPLDRLYAAYIFSRGLLCCFKLQQLCNGNT